MIVKVMAAQGARKIATPAAISVGIQAQTRPSNRRRSAYRVIRTDAKSANPFASGNKPRRSRDDRAKFSVPARGVKGRVGTATAARTKIAEAPKAKARR